MGRRRWPWIGAAIAMILVGVLLGLLALPQGPPVNPSHPAALLYQAHCATCHGVTGQGDSWRARLLFLHPGNLTDAKAMRAFSDDSLFQIIKHGGASFGKPGMPSFGFYLSDEEIRALVSYVRTLTVPTQEQSSKH